jgi:hypothetical protein
MKKVTKLEQLAEIYVDWNVRKITGDQAMARVQALYPRVTGKVWRERMNDKTV